MANDTRGAFGASVTDKDVPAFGTQIPQTLCPQRIHVTTTFMPPIAEVQPRLIQGIRRRDGLGHYLYVN